MLNTSIKCITNSVRLSQHIMLGPLLRDANINDNLYMQHTLMKATQLVHYSTSDICIYFTLTLRQEDRFKGVKDP